MDTRALVLAGGGVGGIAWLLGLIDGLRGAEVDLAGADRLIGTSAGSVVATQLATDQLDAAVAMQLRESGEIHVEFDMERFLADMGRAAAEATGRADASRRIANVAPLNPEISEARRRQVVAARLPVPDWPDRPLALTAVEQASGERVVFDRSGEADLVSAVAASCAVPGVWPPTTIGARAYVDGGVHSSSNADLAAGTDRTLVLVPTAVDAQFEKLLAWETRQLAPGTSLVVRADEESLAAIGPNALDPSRRAAALAAGRDQAGRDAARIADFWS